MQNQQQSLQNQTAQPAPDVQDPQQTGQTNLQPTLNQQNLDAGQSTISLPSGTSTTQTTGSTQADSTQGAPMFDVSTPLLIATFAFALILIALLAKMAQPKHEHQPTENEQAADVAQPAQSVEDKPQHAPKKPKPQKKLTRRQRKQIQQKRR